LSAERPIEHWKFLLGEWKGIAEGEYQEKGKIESTAAFSLEPSDKYIMGRTESRKDGILVNRSISFMFYDGTEKKFRRKTVFSYGFVNNEVEYQSTADEIRFDVIVEPDHSGFINLKWRSYIRKISERRIVMGLESAKVGEEFNSYGKTIYEKI
jgi:hypothetical protein